MMTGLEAVKGKWALKVAEYNDQINKIGEEQVQSYTQAIGFALPPEEEEDYEDD